MKRRGNKETLRMTRRRKKKKRRKMKLKKNKKIKHSQDKIKKI